MANFLGAQSQNMKVQAVILNADGVAQIDQGTVFIGGTTTAVTLPDPDTSRNGTFLLIIATSASAHTVTNTTGFNGGGGASDVATFGGAVGDSMILTAFNGTWLVVALNNVTIA